MIFVYSGKEMDCVFFINPMAGAQAGKNIAAELKQDLHTHGIGIHVVFTDPENLESQVLSLAPGRDLIVVAGGDGTISAVARILSTLESPPPFAVIPLGTGNDLARSLGWWKVWHHGGLDYFWSGVSAGKIEAMDLWSCGEDLAFLGYAGFGLDARIVGSVSRLRRKVFGKNLGRRWNQLLYMSVGLKHILSVRLRGGSSEIDASFSGEKGSTRKLKLKNHTALILSNIKHYAGGGSLSSLSSWSDGQFEAYVIPTVEAYLNLLFRGRIAFFREHEATFQACSVEIVGKRELPLQIDGEWAGDCKANNIVKVQLIRTLPVLVPPQDFSVREPADRRWSASRILKKDTAPALPDPATTSLHKLVRWIGGR